MELNLGDDIGAGYLHRLLRPGRCSQRQGGPKRERGHSVGDRLGHRCVSQSLAGVSNPEADNASLVASPGDLIDKLGREACNTDLSSLKKIQRWPGGRLI